MKKLLFIAAILILLLVGCGIQGGNLDTDQVSDSTTGKTPVLIGEIVVKDGDILRRDIIPQLSQVFGLTQKEVKGVLSEAGKKTVYYENVKDYRSFEGVILPGKHQVYEGDNLEKFLGDCLNDFEKAVQRASSKVIKKNNLSLSQQIVLASIIQAECLKGEYLNETSTVFQNRIIDGSKLQSCVTTEYALEYQRSFLTADDVKKESPYNTYYSGGLPPGLICSFSPDCLKAAMTPKMDSDIHYFYYDYLDGEMHFYSDYTFFTNDANKAFDEFSQQSNIGTRDKINKQKLYSK